MKRCPVDIKKDIKKESDLQIFFGLMAEGGWLKETFDKKADDLMYSLTDSGEKIAIESLKTDEDVLHMFVLFMDLSKMEYPDFNRRLIECALFFKEDIGVNIFRVILRNRNYIKGLKLRENIPEDILKKFD